MPRRAWRASSNPAVNDAAPLADVREADRDRRLQALLELADACQQPLLAVVQDAQERARRVVAAVEEGAGRRRRERTLELVGGRGGGEDEIALVEVAAEPGGAALEPGQRLAPGELLEEVLDQVLLREALDEVDLLQRDRCLVRDGAGEVDLRRAGRGQEAEELVVGDERDGHGRRTAAAGKFWAQLGEADLRPGVAWARGGRAQVQHLGSRVEQVQVARAGAQELPRAGSNGREQGIERLRPCQGLAQLGEVLELVDAAPHFFVQTRVLDGARDERGARDQHLDLELRELARGLGVARDDADDVAVLAHDGHGDERLEALLLELGDVLHTGVVEQLVADPGRLLVLRRPPREALAPVERDRADEVRVRIRGGLQHQAIALDQVHEAGVDGAGVGQEPHDAAQHLLQVQGRSDRRDDGVQDPVLTGVDARRAYGRMVGRIPSRVSKNSARGSWEKPSRLLHPGYRRGSARRHSRHSANLLGRAAGRRSPARSGPDPPRAARDRPRRCRREMRQAQGEVRSDGRVGRVGVPALELVRVTGEVVELLLAVPVLGVQVAGRPHGGERPRPGPALDQQVAPERRCRVAGRRRGARCRPSSARRSRRSQPRSSVRRRCSPTLRETRRPAGIPGPRMMSGTRIEGS